MQRIRILGGRAEGRLWRTLGDAAERFTPGEPLHLTTRQDVEFHGATASAVPELQAFLADHGLTGLGACGDTPRNLTLCPGGGLCRGSVDLLPLARLVHETLVKEEDIFRLPRKFKISFSSCPRGCAMPWINDLAFVAAPRPGGRGPQSRYLGIGVPAPGETGFEVIGAGSLGPRPATGIRLVDWIPAEDVIPCALAVVRVFAAHGDRRNRARARLRHARERLGNEKFLELFRAEFESRKNQWRRRGDRADVRVPAPQADRVEKVRLTFANGNVFPPAARELAELLERHPAEARINFVGGVTIFGRDVPSLRSAVESFPALRVAAFNQPAVVPCPGTRWCKRAIVETQDLADRIRRELSAVAADGASLPAVHISGCPNGCSQNAVAPIGLVGRVGVVEGQRQECFDVFASGGGGRNDQLARPVAQRVPAADVPAFVARLCKS